jgi:hypothetical protein
VCLYVCGAGGGGGLGVVSLCIMADESGMRRHGGQEVRGVSEIVLLLPGTPAGSLACT